MNGFMSNKLSFLNFHKFLSLNIALNLQRNNRYYGKLLRITSLYIKTLRITSIFILSYRFEELSLFQFKEIL